MAYLTFALNNPQLSLEPQKDTERWYLTFDAKVEREPGTFTIFSDGIEHNGYTLDGSVFIECQSPQLPSPTLPEEERPGYIDLVTIPPEYRTGDTAWTRLGVVARLSSDPFFRLFQACAEARPVEMKISTPTARHDAQEGFTFGPDPDGRDIEWHINNTNRVLLASLRFRIKAANPSSDACPPQVAQQEAPVPEIVSVDTASVVTAVNRLFGAVLIVILIIVTRH